MKYIYNSWSYNYVSSTRNNGVWA